MIEPDHKRLSIVRQCELLGLPRSSYYRVVNFTGGEPEENQHFMRLIDEEYTRHPFYGRRQMTTTCGAKDIV